MSKEGLGTGVLPESCPGMTEDMLQIRGQGLPSVCGQGLGWAPRMNKVTVLKEYPKFRALA